MPAADVATGAVGADAVALSGARAKAGAKTKPGKKKKPTDARGVVAPPTGSSPFVDVSGDED